MTRPAHPPILFCEASTEVLVLQDGCACPRCEGSLDRDLCPLCSGAGCLDLKNPEVLERVTAFNRYAPPPPKPRPMALEKFMELADACAGAMPPDGAPVARKLAKAYEAALGALNAAREDAKSMHYLWGVTLGRIESAKKAMDLAQTKLTYDCFRESVEDHTKANA